MINENCFKKKRTKDSPLLPLLKTDFVSILPNHYDCNRTRF